MTTSVPFTEVQGFGGWSCWVTGSWSRPHLRRRQIRSTSTRPRTIVLDAPIELSLEMWLERLTQLFSIIWYISSMVRDHSWRFCFQWDVKYAVLYCGMILYDYYFKVEYILNVSLLRFPCGLVCTKIEFGGVCLQMWRVVFNMLDTQPRGADNMWSFTFGVVMDPTASQLIKTRILRTVLEGCCEHENEILSSLKIGKILE
jgi:hypothetical protein